MPSLMPPAGLTANDILFYVRHVYTGVIRECKRVRTFSRVSQAGYHISVFPVPGLRVDV